MSTPTPLSVVMPAYRLGTTISENIRTVLTALSEFDLEVVVVDDGSDDDTGTEIERAAERDSRVVAAHHPVNLGKGDALVTGWGRATKEFVVFLDGDLDLPPDQIPGLLPLLDDADAVFGTKHGRMGEDGYPGLRRILSRIFARVTTGVFLLPFSETQTGLKLFRRAALDPVLPAVGLRGYAFDLELAVRLHRSGARVVEAPVRLGPGAAGASLRLSMIWDLFRDTLRLLGRTLTDPSLRRRGSGGR